MESSVDVRSKGIASNDAAMRAAFLDAALPMPGQTSAEAGSDAEAALLALLQALQAQQYRFTTVTPATHARVNRRQGKEWAASIEDVLGWSRPFKQEVLPAPLFALMRAAGVAVPHGANGWRSTIRVSSLDDLLFMHSAYPTTAADAVFFGPDTYRFVSAVTSHLANTRQPVCRAVDIGCGAGPGAIMLAKLRPYAEVLAVDINDAALRLTRVNAALAATPNVATRISNLLSATDGDFDLIIANPPYLLDADERAYRHGGGGLGEGLSMAIVRTALERLAPGGTLLLYTGIAIVGGVDHFRAQVADLLKQAAVDWQYREMDPDVFGEELDEPAYAEADRIAAVVLTLTRHAE